MRNVVGAVVVSLFVLACGKPSADQYAADVMKIADDYHAARLANTPESVYFLDIDVDHHDQISDNSLGALAAWQSKEDAFLARVKAVDMASLNGRPQWILLGQMKENLEANIAARVCRQELWGVNHMSGWHTFFPRLAQMQPVGNESLRIDALNRWQKVAGFIDTEIANLREGVDQGYLAPKRATQRVINQVNGLLDASADNHPLLDPIRRDDSAEFTATFTAIIMNEVIPAYTRYRDYLQDEYMAVARDALGVSANPDGVACYEASYRSYTTLNRTAQQVHDLGAATVEGYKQDVVAMGAEKYGSDDFVTIVTAATEDPNNQFQSQEQMEMMLDEVVLSAGAAMPQVFSHMPSTPVEVRPYPEFLQGTGMSARYERARGDEPGIYRYDPTGWNTTTQASAQITAVHEAYPGHHMQFAFIAEIPPIHPILNGFFNSAFGEGWARYSEALAEELNLYTNDAAFIQRRAWPARGMVVDTGVHVLGWTNEQALAFLAESGRMIGEDGERMLDRISVLPAQLTSYDSGALEIFALRREAEAALGEDFDLKVFHTKLLENGVIPLWMLRQKMEEWYLGK